MRQDNRFPTLRFVISHGCGANGMKEAIDVPKVDFSLNGIALQDRESIAAIGEGREPNDPVEDVLDCYR